MSISELILKEEYVEAKAIITEHMNRLALDLLDEIKAHYARNLFVTEEIDAKFKGKTDMDFVKDAKAEAGEDDQGSEDDVPEPEEDDEASEEDEPEEDDGDEDEEDDNKKSIKSKSGNVTVNIKEGIVPVAHGKPSKDQPGGGAAENPKWKGKQKALMAMKKALNKTATTAIVKD